MHPISYFSQNWLVFKLNNQFISEHLPQMKGVVYDLGCGTRPHEKDILNYASRYVGVDWSNTLHELKADISADLNKILPIESAVADNVVSFQVLEHLCEPQVMLNEAFRILKPGGKIFLSVPFQWWIHEAPFDYFRFTTYGLKHVFTKAGFEDLTIQEVTGFWSMWILKFNYQTVKLIRGPRPLRWLLKGVLLPFWWLGQTVFPLMDQFWNAPQETGFYFVTGRKP